MYNKDDILDGLIILNTTYVIDASILVTLNGHTYFNIT